MSLLGSITNLQNNLEQLYLQLQQRFSENQLIRALWSDMAHDIQQQKRSMTAIPSAFWHQLKAEQDALAALITEHSRKHAIEIKGDVPLKAHFESALLLEEPAILKIYIPIIRKLRENWTDRALDFYIMVKAHLARITRVTQAFAGDPIIIQRANLLLQNFEKDVQEPHVVVERKLPLAHTIHPHPEKESHTAKPQPKPQKKADPKPKKAAIAKHAPKHHKRTKPIVEKIAIKRRGVRR